MSCIRFALKYQYQYQIRLSGMLSNEPIALLSDMLCCMYVCTEGRKGLKIATREGRHDYETSSQPYSLTILSPAIAPVRYAIAWVCALKEVRT